ncbi:hypothetical protein FAM18126_02329 [Lacticaseibacillus paracasei]|uniref:DUF1642 domain-containing protein n=1 Tax=Lacticaseibacillus paracasei TaxID=1597 RepID=UPI000FF5EACF|nr:DUF1642 domain-containing protein [Lacticaseibacillus paracasei]RND64411.1 hypothetical protein FAM18126_02329 [Lacticaseibacillus paracasei]
MSDEKLYAVKDDEGKYWDFSGKVTGFWARSEVEVPATDDKDLASALAMGCGDHVVTFVEEPKKVVLTEEQAEIVDFANSFYLPARYISNNSGEDEELLINAYVNGYTVAKEKEKKYNVKVPHAEGWHFQKYSRESRQGPRNNWKPFPVKDTRQVLSKDLFLFTESEIEHYGLQDCEKEEVTDDEQ